MKPPRSQIIISLCAFAFMAALLILREWMTLLLLGCMICVLFVGWSFDTKRWIFASVITLLAVLGLVVAFYVERQAVLLAVAGGSIAGAAEVWHSLWRKRKRKGYVQTASHSKG